MAPLVNGRLLDGRERMGGRMLMEHGRCRDRMVVQRAHAYFRRKDCGRLGGRLWCGRRRCRRQCRATAGATTGSLAAVLVVTLDVLGQVITAHESPLADVTNKLLLAGVCALVAGQLVRAGKATAAVRPLAVERPLAGVDALVRLQVARFEVVFATVRVITLVNASSFRFAGDGRCFGGGGFAADTSTQLFRLALGLAHHGARFAGCSRHEQIV